MQEGNDITEIPFNTMSDLKDTTYLDGVRISYIGDYKLMEKTIRDTLAAAHHFRPGDQESASARQHAPNDCAH